MRRLATGATLLLLLALVPVPSAQAASWSVDATVSVTSATTADYTWRIGLSTPTRLTLPLPDDAMFVEARDVDGKLLEASADAEEVTVTSGNKPFLLQFALVGEEDGPFSLFRAQVASASDSPVSVSIALPEGWSLAGYRDGDDRVATAEGAFHGDGPAYVQYLVLRPGFTDPGPTVGIAGDVVRREGVAEIGLGGASWSLTTTYDTDVYGRSWDVHVPPGATVASATSPFGPLVTEREGDVLRVTSPYPVGYGLGARTFTVNLSLPAPTPHGGTFREMNLSIRAAPEDDVQIRARLADGLRYTGARTSEGSFETAPLEFIARGPMSVGIAFLPPPAPGHVQFEEGLFVVDAPASLEAAARATARNASALLPQAAYFVYDLNETRPFYVAYTHEPVFAWEEGFYSNGLNTISIRADTLDDAADGRPHLVPVGVLVHEAAHGLIDRRLPDAPHDLSFLHEGLARLAETHLEAYFPLSEIIEQQGSSFTRHSARPSDETLRTFHQQGQAFDVAWHASEVADEERGRLYDYSGLVLHAFERRAPPNALPNALAFVNATNFSSDSLAASSTLLDIFLANSPGTTSTAFLYPGREASTLHADEFRYCMRGLIAPPYEWQDERAPAGGCPPTGYGPRDATLPTPPASIAPTPPSPVFIEPTPVVAPTPPPRTDASGPTTNEPDTSAEVPGAVVEPPRAPTPDGRPGSSTPTQIPHASLPLMLAAVGAALAIAAGRGPRR